MSDRLGVYIRCFPSLYHGYGKVAIELCRFFVRSGIKLRVSNLSKTGARHGIPDDVLPFVTDAENQWPWELIVGPPDFPLSDGKRSVYVTMWETTRLHPRWVDRLNRCDLVVVPSEFCRTIFDAAGVNSRVSVVPLGVDHSVFKPVAGNSQNGFVVGTSGRFHQGGVRKGVYDVVEAYGIAFAEQNVSLQIKLPSDSPLPDGVICFADERIEVIREDWSDERMARWYRSLSAYVTASRCEGFGLQVLEAMSCGCPVVGISYSGQRDLLDQTTGLCVDYDLKPARGMYDSLGLWAEPNLWSLKDALGRVGSRSSALLANNALVRSNQFSWEHTCHGVLQRLQNIGYFDEPAGTTLPSGISVKSHDEPDESGAPRDDFVKKFGVGRAAMRDVPAKPVERVVKTGDGLVVMGPEPVECGVGEYARNIASVLGAPWSPYGSLESNRRLVLLHFHRNYYEKLAIGKLVHDLWVSGHDIVLDVHDPGGVEQIADYVAGIVYHTTHFTDYLAEAAPGVPCSLIPLACPPVDGGEADEKTSCMTTMTTITTDRLIGWHGLWNPHKGVDLLIEAVKILRDRGASIGLSAFGAIHRIDKDAESRSLETFEQCQRLVDMWQLTDRVALSCDTFSKRDISIYLSRCDIFCIPYTTGGIKGQSSAALSMLRFGRPILVSDTPMFTDIIQDGGAKPLDEMTARCIADTVQHYLCDPQNGRSEYDKCCASVRECYEQRRNPEVVGLRYREFLDEGCSTAR